MTESPYLHPEYPPLVELLAAAQTVVELSPEAPGVAWLKRALAAYNRLPT